MATVITSVAGLLLQRKETKAIKSAAQDATDRANEQARKIEEAEVKAQTEAEETLRKKQAGQTQTVLTSPLGVSSEANVKKPTLLGVG